jgi:hypothetical protein
MSAFDVAVLFYLLFVIPSEAKESTANEEWAMRNEE